MEIRDSLPENCRLKYDTLCITSSMVRNFLNNLLTKNGIKAYDLKALMDVETKISTPAKIIANIVINGVRQNLDYVLAEILLDIEKANRGFSLQIYSHFDMKTRNDLRDYVNL